MMDLILLIVVLAVVGVAVHLLTQLPMAAPFRTVIYVIVVIALVLYLLRRFGGGIPDLL